MSGKDLRWLFLLSAIWGLSFPLMRVAAPAFGPIALVALRALIGAVFLLGILLATGRLSVLLANWKVTMFCGLLSLALPFTCLSYAAIHLPSGMLSVINALTPLFGALFAWAWLGERLTGGQAAGLALGLVGIAILVSDRFASPGSADWLPILAAVAGPVFYGIGACFASRYLRGIEPMVCATGCMIGTLVALLPFAILLWPQTQISVLAWFSGATLGLLCTGIAYVIYYGLIARVGPSRTVTVTYLVPPFGILLGIVLLDEPLTWRIALGACIVLAGTLLATGAYRAGQRRA